MNIWLLVITAIASFPMGLKNFSDLKQHKSKENSIYYLFATICFITPAIGFSYLFLNLSSSIKDAIFLGIITGSLMTIPMIIMKFYYKKNSK